MLQPPPAQPGMREDEIDTPALVIDLDAFEYNLDTMAALLAPHRREAAGARQDAQIAGYRAVCRWPAARSASACRRSPRPRCWPGAACPTSWSATRSSARQAGPAFARCRSIAEVAVCADDPVPRRRHRGRGGERGHAAFRAGGDRRRRRPLRRRARAPTRWRWRSASPPSKHLTLRRHAGLSRQRPAPAHAGRTAAADRRAPSTAPAAPWSSCASRAWTARSSAAPAPARSSSRRPPACSPRCRPAATCSWTPTTAATSTRRQAGLARSAMRCSCWRRS